MPESETSAEPTARQLSGAVDEARGRALADPSLVRRELLPALTALLASIDAVITHECPERSEFENLTAMAVDNLETFFSTFIDIAEHADATRLTDLVETLREVVDVAEFHMGRNFALGASYRVLTLMEIWARPAPFKVAAACAAAVDDQLRRLMDGGKADHGIKYSLLAISWCEPHLHTDPPLGREAGAVAHHRHAQLLQELGSPLELAGEDGHVAPSGRQRGRRPRLDQRAAATGQPPLGSLSTGVRPGDDGRLPVAVGFPLCEAVGQ